VCERERERERERDRDRKREREETERDYAAAIPSAEILTLKSCRKDF
jgi:hypothetical protein